MGSKTDLPQTLRVEAGYYFGSLRNAQRALKNDQNCGVAGARKRLSPSFPGCIGPKTGWPTRSARREVPALVSAAEAYFGSWGKALYAARIDPNLYFVRRKWHGPSVRGSIAGVPRHKQ